MPTRLPADELVAREVSAPERRSEVEVLIHELLDAHPDTMQMAAGLEYDRAWQAHLEYVRALHRKGCEVLASIGVMPA